MPLGRKPLARQQMRLEVAAKIAAALHDAAIDGKALAFECGERRRDVVLRSNASASAIASSPPW